LKNDKLPKQKALHDFSIFFSHPVFAFQNLSPQSEAATKYNNFLGYVQITDVQKGASKTLYQN